EPLHQLVDRPQMRRLEIPVKRSAVEIGAAPTRPMAGGFDRESGGHSVCLLRFSRQRTPRTRGMTRVGQGSGISPTGTSINDGPPRFKAAANSRRNSSGLVARTPAMP